MKTHFELVVIIYCVPQTYRFTSGSRAITLVFVAIWRFYWYLPSQKYLENGIMNFPYMEEKKENEK